MAAAVEHIARMDIAIEQGHVEFFRGFIDDIVGLALVSKMIAFEVEGGAGIGRFAVSHIHVQHIEEFDRFGLRTRRTDADDALYIVLVEQFVRIDTDRGAAHAAGAYRNRHALVGTGKIKGIAGLVNKLDVLDIVLGNVFGSQRVARQ